MLDIRRKDRSQSRSGEFVLVHWIAYMVVGMYIGFAIGIITIGLLRNEFREEDE